MTEEQLPGQFEEPAKDQAEDAPEPVRRSAGVTESLRANRAWWDGEAEGYYAEHGRFLGDARFVWGPEGLEEADARLLGDVAGRRVLEIGCGGAQCSRWLRTQGAEVVASDLSAGMLRRARAIDAAGATRTGERAVPLLQADAARLPLADASVDLACSAYGALPFVADSAAVMREVARVLRPGGRFVFSVTHPVRWALPDDPGLEGLVVRMSYFDRTPYVEQDGSGRAVYVEHHRTLGDRVRELVGAGLVLEDLVEPEWPEGHDQAWGGWSPLRGALLPGTAIFCCRRP
ncbi:MAG TPA: class I SAM-dependent methyltransferase [Actinomycetales bacterium]|nr:class I SAM-dependent methyltransferase [Actinomycetales bacterium]